jgi:hypothetical protein
VLKKRELQQKKLLITKCYKLFLYLITLLLMLPLITAAALADQPLKLALFDTPICQKYNYTKIYPHITIAKNIWPSSVEPNDRPCPEDIDRKFYRSFHGHYVLRNILKNISSKRKIIIHPLVLFDHSGKQRLGYWSSALNWSKKNKINLQVIAAGLPISRPNKLKLTAPSLVAAGNIGLGINPKTILWPQSSKSQLMILIGSFLPSKLPTPYNGGIYLDPNQLNQKLINFAFDGAGEKNIRFGGTSYAVAVAAGRVISACHQQLSRLKTCIKRAATKLHFINSARSNIYTLP